MIGITPSQYPQKDRQRNRQMKISAKFGEGNPIEVEFNAGKNLDEACDLYGEQAVFNNYLANVRVGGQGVVRALQKTAQTSKPPRKLTVKEAQNAVNKYKPGVRRRGKSPVEKIVEKYQSYTLDQRKEVREYIKNMPD